ncbi:uncharacterized protein A4U43_C01F27490 [Asparagus officinalis]|uniref:Uncharacterized protein n=1 Tax=Asparagus officinalis TaxID=4686 RepID=A0A5P1FT71_ASPOF|nr:uncharacterized protein A4U43_C01F27490 [Asparagus officinalis]
MTQTQWPSSEEQNPNPNPNPNPPSSSPPKPSPIRDQGSCLRPPETPPKDRSSPRYQSARRAGAPIRVIPAASPAAGESDGRLSSSSATDPPPSRRHDATRTPPVPLLLPLQTLTRSIINQQLRLQGRRTTLLPLRHPLRRRTSIDPSPPPRPLPSPRPRATLESRLGKPITSEILRRSFTLGFYLMI